MPANLNGIVSHSGNAGTIDPSRSYQGNQTSTLRQPLPFPMVSELSKDLSSQVPLSKSTSMTINLGNLPVSLVSVQ